VYDKLKPLIPDLSLGTVYRNINIFRAEGRVISVGVVDGEERFDGRVEPHPHFLCERCGAVIDLGESVQSELSANFSIKIPGCTVDTRKTLFCGTCKDCEINRACETGPAIPAEYSA
jgi:Fur family peroxide stress response transcriptional regulator